jgi:murein DD-endopeptidase MepM/ murein hydrolase activator NlpD
VRGAVVTSVYGHMQAGSLTRGVGDRVNLGQRIGRVGNTGSSTGAHLHFEIHPHGSRAVNPLSWLRKHVNS